MAGKDRYKKPPKIAEKEERAKPEKEERAAAKPKEKDKGEKMDAPIKDGKTDMGNKKSPKPSEQAGDKDVPVHEDMQTRHGTEMREMHERHEEERGHMHKRHEKEHKKMMKRHGKEMGHDEPEDEDEGETEE